MGAPRRRRRRRLKRPPPPDYCSHSPHLSSRLISFETPPTSKFHLELRRVYANDASSVTSTLRRNLFATARGNAGWRAGFAHSAWVGGRSRTYARRRPPIHSRPVTLSPLARKNIFSRNYCESKSLTSLFQSVSELPVAAKTPEPPEEASSRPESAEIRRRRLRQTKSSECIRQKKVSANRPTEESPAAVTRSFSASLVRSPLQERTSVSSSEESEACTDVIGEVAGLHLR